MRVNEQMFYSLLSKNFNLPCIESQIRRSQSQKHTFNQWHLIFVTTKTQKFKNFRGPAPPPLSGPDYITRSLGWEWRLDLHYHRHRFLKFTIPTQQVFACVEELRPRHRAEQDG